MFANSTGQLNINQMSRFWAGLLAFFTCCSTPKINQWGKINEPTSGQSRAVGTYPAGCLAGAKALPLEGEGFQVLRSYRRRFFGHSEMIHFITLLGKKTRNARLADLYIGDISQPRGGPAIPGHGSHQIGLDADIYFNWNGENSLSVVGPGGRMNPKLWTRDQFRLLELAANQPQVDRIFVSPWIKKEICRNHSQEPWIAKLRPWWGHDEHFHVRLKCPEGDTACVGQPPVTDPGCDATLAWWFGEEASKVGGERKKAAEAGDLPKLPRECGALLE